VPVSESAARRFEEGVRYLRSHDPDRYEKAYREFKAAYAESPSWKILGNLGIVAQELERDGEAIDAYEKYLEGGAKELTKAEKKQFKNDLLLLESGLTTVTLRTLPDGAWIVDERLPDSGTPIVNRYGPTSGPLELRLRAGHHRIRAELDGYEVDSWELSEAAGSSVSHDFELRREEAPVAAVSAPPPPPPMHDAGSEPRASSSSLPTWGFVSLGVGAVGLGVGTWFLLDIDAKSAAADEAYAACLNSSMQDPPSCSTPSDARTAALEAQEAEHRTRTLSIVGFSAGAAFVATGVILLLVSSGDTEPAEQARVTPWLGPSSVGVAGTF
jgi:hypothetical protein